MSPYWNDIVSGKFGDIAAYQPPPLPTEVEKAEMAAIEANQWVTTELEWCDLQLKLHTTADPRAVATQEQIATYARDLRNYVRQTPDGLRIMTAQPARPQ